MSLLTLLNRKDYDGDGIVVAFGFPYLFPEDSDLDVYIHDTVALTTTLQTLTTHYTVTGAGDDAGGTVTMIATPTSTEELIIIRILDATFKSTYSDYNRLPSATQNADYSRLTMLIQQIQEELGRAVIQPITATTGIVLPDYELGKVLEWSSVTDVLQNSTLTLADAQAAADAKDASAVSAAAALVSELAAASSADSIDPANMKMNIAYNRLQIIANNSLSLGIMVDGWADAFNDETGIDNALSTVAFYEPANDLYTNKDIGANVAVYFKFDDQADDTFATVTDSSTNAGTVVIVGGNTSNFSHETTAADVKFGTGAWKSIGTGTKHLTIPEPGSASFNPTQHTNWTLSFFLKKTATGSGTVQFVINNPGGASRWEVRFKNGDAEKVEFVLNQSGGPNFEFTSTTNIVQDTYTHYAIVRVGNDMAIYQDGTWKAADDITGVISETMGSLQLFADNAGTTSIVGILDDVFISTDNIFGADPSDSGDTITVPTGNGGGHVIQAMVLVSEDQEATSQPDTAQCIVIVDDGGNSLTANTDIKLYASRDDGSTFTAAVLTLEQDFGSNIKLYEAEVDISGQTADKTMRYKVETSATYEVKIVDASMLWS